jgi:hypothetical protein
VNDIISPSILNPSGCGEGIRAAPAFLIMLLLSSVLGCAAYNGREEELSDGSTDSGTDSDTDTDIDADSGIDWDTDFDGGAVSDAVLLTEVDSIAKPLMAFDGANLAVSWNTGIVTQEYFYFDGTGLMVFPWNQPENLHLGQYPNQAPACPSTEWGNIDCLSQPYPFQQGFVTLTSSFTGKVSPGGVYEKPCHAVWTEWDLNADVVLGPFSFWNIYEYVGADVISNSPIGPMDSQRGITVGNFTDFLNEDGTGLFQMDRFGPEEEHETMVESFEFDLNDIGCPIGMDWDKWYAATFTYDGMFTAVNMYRDVDIGDIDDPVWIQGALVLAQVMQDGEILFSPEIVHVSPERQGYVRSGNAAAFAQNEDEILLVHTQSYQSLVDKYDCITDRYSILLDMSGNLVNGPTILDTHPVYEYLEDEAGESHPGLTWSGKYYGYCDLYQDGENQQYEFRLLNEQGAQVKNPIRLFWRYPPSEPEPPSEVYDGRFYNFCDIAAIGERTFAIVAYMPVTDEHPRGIYIIYVKFGPVV